MITPPLRKNLTQRGRKLSDFGGIFVPCLAEWLWFDRLRARPGKPENAAGFPLPQQKGLALCRMAL
jgi:hypothetical protein